MSAALVLAALILFFALFDWNWLRAPLEHYVTQKTHRVLRIGNLAVTWGLPPTIRMRDVYFENAPWSAHRPMATVGELEFSVSLGALLHGQFVLPQLSIADGDVWLERTADGRKNWVFSSADERAPSRTRILTLHAERSSLTYVNRAKHFEVTFKASGIADPGLLHSTDSRFQTRLHFKGRYRDAPFSGEALTGNLMSLQQSAKPFPLLGYLEAGHTRLDVDGTVSDVVDLSAIDAQVKIKGPTLRNLYPFLLLPLPASPAYELSGHLTYQRSQYAYEAFKGKIGESDIRGDATYDARLPRPLLKIKLHSRLLALSDLGPLIGTGATSSGAAAAAGSKSSAPQSGPAPAENDRLLPRKKIDPERLKVVDAEVELDAQHLEAPAAYAFQSLRFELSLKNGHLHVNPLDLGLAGGHLVGQITLDANVVPTAAKVSLEARGLDLAHFVPHSTELAPSNAKIAARINLEGRGDSVGAALADAKGSASAVVSGGRVSNLADALVGLNGAKVLGLLATGDKDIALRCAAIDLDVRDGVGQTRVFVIDTAQTQILGSGSINLATEQLDLTLHPEPKKPSILSLRSPIHLSGSFKHPTFSVNKAMVAARAGGAIALGILNPLAALLPLLEPGPGHDTNCAALLGHH